MIDQIGTDGVMLVRHERDLQFGADAIDTRDQYRFTHSAKIRRKESAESADFSQHYRTMRLAHKRLNSALQFIAEINVDAGASVSLFHHITGGTRAACSRTLSESRP